MKMKTLKIKDNTKIDKQSINKIKTLKDKIENKSLSYLEKEGIFVFPNHIKESEDLEEKQIILQRVNDFYQTGNVMGFLGFENDRLLIQSRFSSNEDDFFFKYLLNQVILSPNIISLETNINLNDEIFNYLLFFFPYYLKEAIRKGLFKKYIIKRYNDKNIKGIIDISNHIKKNTPFLGNIAYSQREFSYDNFLTELIRHTIEFIRSKPYGKLILTKIKEESELIIKATPTYKIHDRQKIINENQKRTINHAYYKEYRKLQHLCLLILNYKKHQLGLGEKTVFGILVDGSWLWEEYLNNLLKKRFYHPQNKSYKNAQRLFKNNGTIFPDFIGKDPKNRIIADAKYKPINNIGNKDYLQLIAYMNRFDAKKGYFLYPNSENSPNQCFYLNKGITYENNVVAREDTIVFKNGLLIPNNVSNFSEFEVKMKENENKFIQDLNL